MGRRVLAETRRERHVLPQRLASAPREMDAAEFRMIDLPQEASRDSCGSRERSSGLGTGAAGMCRRCASATISSFF